MNYKDQIFALREEGKTYNEITEIVGCAKSTVSYFLNSGVKRKYQKRHALNRQAFMKELKTEAGGKCCKCGYSRCFAALHFHHLGEEEKITNIASLITTASKDKVRDEARKCILVCANCHAEIHN